MAFLLISACFYHDFHYIIENNGQFLNLFGEYIQNFIFKTINIFITKSIITLKIVFFDNNALESFLNQV